MLSIEESGTATAVSVTSDLTKLWEGSLRWSLETLDGEQLQTGGYKVSAAPLANTPICALDFEQQVSGGIDRNTVFICELWQGQERVALQVATFVPNKHLELVEPGLTAVVHQLGDQLVVSVTANALARFVELSFDGVDVVFSDNYFDLPAGRTMHVTCPLPEGWTLERAQTALKIRSLYDSFA
jgi:beta-mannosidase